MSSTNQLILALGLTAVGCGPSPGGDDSPSVDWAIDTFYIVTEIHGEATQFEIEKIRLLPDGTTEQTTILCGVEDRVFRGTWRATDEGVVVEPPPGEDVVAFAKSDYSKLLLTESDRCEEVRMQGYNPAGIEAGDDTLLRGDLCLNCAALDFDQLQCCDSMQPISICDISGCE
jgi:hypothetical protein